VEQSSGGAAGGLGEADGNLRRHGGPDGSEYRTHHGGLAIEGQLDNTLIVFLSDNSACAEWTRSA
jgi:arylsulfatase A-like enzyme